MFDQSAASFALAECGSSIDSEPIVAPARNSSAKARARTEASTEMSTCAGAGPPAMSSLSAKAPTPLRRNENSPTTHVGSHSLGGSHTPDTGGGTVARTPLAGRLEELAAEVGGGYTRRDALKRAGVLTGAAMAASATGWAPLANAATAPRIAVVGGGLAGLTATYRLKQAGFVAQLYEARTDRLGGRCWSDPFPGSNLIYEHGGELIDQGHTEIRQLAQELGLTLVNLVASETNGTEPFHLFDSQFYSFDDATNDLKGVWQQIHSDVSAASYPTQWNSNTQRGRELDAMSIIDWINAYVPGR